MVYHFFLTAISEMMDEVFTVFLHQRGKELTGLG
jgi:hypothetical protein